ncbi:MAG: GntR family transcriptional regulator [Sedimentisphaeraceae bacterium JB056]
MQRETKKTGHKWRDIRDYIVSMATSGEYKPGDALPSENSICQQAGASRTTVRQALKELENEGFVRRIRGKGTFLADITDKPSMVSKGMHQVFSLVIPEMSEYIYSSLAQGFEGFLANESLQTLICDSGNDISRQGNIFLQLLHKRIDGVAVVPTTDGKTPAFHIQMLIDSGIPVVLCHRGLDGVRVPVVTWDREKVGQIAAEALLEKGHTNIAYYAGHKYEVPLSHVKGINKVFELSDQNVFFGNQGDDDQTLADRENIISGILDSDNRPTAIICNNETEAERVFWVAYRMGLRIPEDISLVGFGDSRRNTIFKKMLTSVVIDESELGGIAAKMLCEINGRQRSINDNSVIYQGLYLYEGASVSDLK